MLQFGIRNEDTWLAAIHFCSEMSFFFTYRLFQWRKSLLPRPQHGFRPENSAATAIAPSAFYSILLHTPERVYQGSACETFMLLRAFPNWLASLAHHHVGEIKEQYVTVEVQHIFALQIVKSRETGYRHSFLIPNLNISSITFVPDWTPWSSLTGLYHWS